MKVKPDRNQSPRARLGGFDGASIAMALAAVATIVAALAAMMAVGHSAPSLASGDAARGEKVYQDCMLCHSLDQNEIGPKHRGVFGRKAGSVADYGYSAALKASNIVWNESTLDRWLTDPQALVPGTKMLFSVDDAQDRTDVIAFLKEKAGNDQSSATVGAR
jgi:cytochrome c